MTDDKFSCLVVTSEAELAGRVMELQMANRSSCHRPTNARHRMNEHAAMGTLDDLSDEEVTELQSRIRRIRRGPEVQEAPYRRAPR